jgi:hypothetical protein
MIFIDVHKMFRLCIVESPGVREAWLDLSSIETEAADEGSNSHSQICGEDAIKKDGVANVHLICPTEPAPKYVAGS